MNQDENDIDIDEHFMDWELGTNAEYKFEAANVNKVDEAKSHKSIIWKVMAVLVVVGLTFIGSIKLMSFGWSDAAKRNLHAGGSSCSECCCECCCGTIEQHSECCLRCKCLYWDYARRGGIYTGPANAGCCKVFTCCQSIQRRNEVAQQQGYLATDNETGPRHAAP